MILFSSVGQFYLFLWSVSFGCIIGIAYEICVFFRKLFKFRLFINIIFDLAISALTIFLFIIYFTYICDFQLRFFIFLGIFLGFFLERISIGNYIAKICDIVYNIYCGIKLKYSGKTKKKRIIKKDNDTKN